MCAVNEAPGACAAVKIFTFTENANETSAYLAREALRREQYKIIQLVGEANQCGWYAI